MSSDWQIIKSDNADIIRNMISELLALDKGSSYLWEDKRDGRESNEGL